MKASKGWRCEECGVVTQRLAVHHIQAVEDTNDPDEMERRCFDENNLQVLCYQCHKQQHEGRIGTHKERERQRSERTRKAMQQIELDDGFDL